MATNQRGHETRTKARVALITILFTLVLGEAALTADERAGLDEKPPVIFVGLDGSGSYDFFTKGKEKLAGLIEAIPPGSDLIVRLLVADSYSDSGVVLTKTLSSDSTSSDNPFDVREKVRKATFLNKSHKEKLEILEGLSKLPYPKSSRTDIFGFLVYAQDKISERYRRTGRPIHILLLTDLQNNVDVYRQDLEGRSLAGVIVKVCVFKQSTPNLKKAWRSIFSGLGVEDLMFFGVDEDLPNLISFRHQADQTGGIR